MLLQLFAAFLCLSHAKTPAQEAGELIRHVKKGTSITVNAYSEKTHAFMLTINSEPGVGPNFADPEQLRVAIASEDSPASFLKNKEQMIGSVYQVKKDLLLITENEMLRRRAKK